MMKCPHCGAMIEDDAKFCTNCGEPVEVQESVIEEPAPALIPEEPVIHEEKPAEEPVPFETAPQPVIQESEPQEEPAEEEPLGDEPPKKTMEKLIRILVLAIVAVMAVVIGITAGIRSYAQRSYNAGKEAYENREYQSAVKSLKSAVKWGAGTGARKLLGDSYMALESYEDAYSVYTEYIEMEPDDTETINQLAVCCEKLGEKAVEAGDYEFASAYFGKEYELTGKETVYRRMKAAENGGQFTDDTGNVFDIYGLPLTLVCTDAGGKPLYKTDIAYNDSHIWTSAKTYADDSAKKTVFASFDKSVQDYELIVYPDGSSYAYIGKGIEYNSDDRITRIALNREAGKEVYSFDYIYDHKGEPQSWTITNKAGDSMVFERQDENKNDAFRVTYKDQSYIALRSMTDDGKLLNFTVTKNLLKVIYKLEYKYNEDGTVSEMTVEDNGLPMTVWMPDGKYSHTVYEYSDGIPLRKTVYNKDNDIAAQGYWISGCGWLTMYNSER